MTGHGGPAREDPGVDRTIEVFVEIPQNSQNKYEYDEERHVLCLDRVLHSAVHYPADYGFVPGTMGEDGDPLDALVLISVPTFPGCHVRARVLGLLHMEDEKGPDAKVLSAAVADPRLSQLRTLADVAPHTLREVEHFFATYKLLEQKPVRVIGWEGADEAWRVIQEGLVRGGRVMPAGASHR